MARIKGPRDPLGFTVSPDRTRHLGGWLDYLEQRYLVR